MACGTKHTILPLSRFGLMQITRQRVRPELAVNTREKCPSCDGTGEISPSILLIDKIENFISDILQEDKLKRINLKVHPFLASFLKKGIFSIRYKLSRKYGCKIKVIPVPSYNFLEFHLFDDSNEEILI